MTPLWRIQLLGPLRAVRADQSGIRFRIQKAGSLLGYAAFYLEHPHPRENLSELLWPEADYKTGRHRLRMALSLLRRQLEPPDIPPGAVIVTDRQSVQLNPETVTTDTAEFSAALANASKAGSLSQKIDWLKTAVDLYRGPLLPGCYEAWIVPQQLRLEDEYVGGLLELLAYWEETGNLTEAITQARAAVSLHPLREELHLALMRLLIAAGQPADALRQYSRLKQLLKNEWGESPSEAAEELAGLARRSGAQTLRSTASGKVPTLPAPASIPAAGLPLPVRSPEKPLHSPVEPPQRADLPLLPVGFFGRENELSWLIPRFLPTTENGHKSHPAPEFSDSLITLTGAAGSGKTRLALEAAKRLETLLPEAVWFVPLAEIVEPHQIILKIHESLGLARLPTANPMDQAVEFLSRQTSLLILDNMEHLLPEGANVLQMLLRRAPTLRCLVTSRQTLNLSIEQEFPLQPLPLPNPSDAPGALIGCPSVQLFAARARRLRPDFEITRANTQAIAELCSRLEGLPLAIELAAARIQMMSPAQILGYLAQRFTLLVDRRKDTGERHRSLHAALEWSYQLLSPELQRLYSRLSLFRGGWTYEAVQEVCGEPLALEGLTELRERSLILAEDDGTAVRFRMLESLREFAGEKLDPAERLPLLALHARYYLKRVALAAGAWWGAEEEVWLDRLDREYENVRAALRWAIEKDPNAAVHASGMLARYWYVRGLFEEGRRWLDETLAGTEGLLSSDRVAALSGAGILARDQADFPYAVRRLEEGLALAHALGDHLGNAFALQRLGIVASDQQDYAQAHRLLEEALQLNRELRNKPGVALSLACLARTTLRQNDLERAAALCREALKEFRGLQHKWGIVTSLYMLGSVEYHRKHDALSVELHRECLAIQRELGNRRGIALALVGLAAATLRLQGPTAARPLLAEGLHGFHVIGDKWGVASALEVTAGLLLQEGDTLLAARMLGAASSLRDMIGMPLTPSERPEHAALVAELQTRLSRSAFDTAFAAGHALSWDQAVLETTQT